jgi:hypothetical protein
MSIPLDRLYHYIESVACKVRNGNTIIYRFYPHGSKKIENLMPLQTYPVKSYVLDPEIYCNDQEPLNFEMYQNEIQDLFNNVIEKSKFKLLVLNKDYFKIFLEEQSQTFKLVGFRENNTLLGFVSYFEINQEIEVHYIGLNYNYNQTNKLYNLMLYKMIELGISENKIEVCMSRTAQEIKSSVGAQPIRVFSFLKITNVFLNFLTPFFLGRLKPKKWSPRSIFK